MMSRQFEFINYQDADDGSREDRQKVRTHVMTDYFWRRRKDVDPAGSELPKCDVRFMQPVTLESPGNLAHVQRKPQRARRRYPTEGTKKPLGVSTVVVHDQLALSDRSGNTPPTSVFPTPECVSGDGPLPPPPTELNPSSFDPFNTLPVQGDPEVGKALQWYFTNSKARVDATIPWLHDLNKMWQQSLWDMAQTNKGILHHLLSTAEELKLYLTGHMNTVSYYSHIGEIIEAIRDGVSDSRAGQCEVFVLLVSTQISRSLADRDYETAKAHMKALQKIVMSNPPWSPNTNNGQQPSFLTMDSLAFSHLMVNDLRLASIMGEIPMMPLQACQAPHPTSPILTTEALKRSVTTLQYMPRGLDNVYNTVNDWHQVSMMLDNRYAQDLDVQSQFNLSFRAFHCLCESVADSQEYADANPGTPIRPLDAILLCMLVFARTCLPSEMPNRFQLPIANDIEVLLIGRVYQGLLSTDDILTFWLNSRASPESLFWVLYRGTVTSCRFDLEDELVWFSDRLRVVAAFLKIVDADRAGQILKIFPWNVHHFDKDFTLICNKLGCSVRNGKAEYEFKKNTVRQFETLIY